jgi:hypothetical protein
MKGGELFQISKPVAQQYTTTTLSAQKRFAEQREFSARSGFPVTSFPTHDKWQPEQRELRVY